MDEGRCLRALLCLVLVLSGPGAWADLPEIEARGALRVLTVLDLDGRSISTQRADSPGFDHEVLEGFAALRHLRLETVPVDGWDRLVPSLVESRGDVIAGSFTVTEARQRVIDFSAEVMPTRSVVVTRRPHRVVSTIEELRGERITVFKGTSMVDLLLAEAVPPSNLDYNVPTEGLSGGLRTGHISCVVQDIQTVFVDRRADPDLQLGMFLGPAKSYAFGVRKSDTALRAALDAYIANVRLSGTWSRLIVKYFGESALTLLRQARGE